MNDPFFVRGLEALRNLDCKGKRFACRDRAAFDALCQCLPEREFHDKELPPSGFFDAMDTRDVGMIERCEHARFTFESRGAFSVVREGFREKLDRYAAAEFAVRGLEDVSHSTGAKVSRDFVVCEPGSNHDLAKMRRGFYQSLMASLTSERPVGTPSACV